VARKAAEAVSLSSIDIVTRDIDRANVDTGKIGHIHYLMREIRVKSIPCSSRLRSHQARRRRGRRDRISIAAAM
jgi:hypothetical protein